MASEPACVVNSVLGIIELDGVLKSAKHLCDEFVADHEFHEPFDRRKVQ